MNDEYSDMFSELSGHSSSKKHASMAHVLFSFAEWTYEKWMGQQNTDPMSFCRCGDHTAAAYSKCGHTRDMYS